MINIIKQIKMFPNNNDNKYQEEAINLWIYINYKYLISINIKSINKKILLIYEIDFHNLDNIISQSMIEVYNKIASKETNK